MRFSLLYSIQNGSGVLPAYYPVDADESFPWEVGFAVRVVIQQTDNCSTPSCAKIKNVWSIPPLPQMSSWHGVLIKAKDSFTFT
jgi:hypothetical protein